MYITQIFNNNRKNELIKQINLFIEKIIIYIKKNKIHNIYCKIKLISK